jgi:hypothetical protein
MQIGPRCGHWIKSGRPPISPDASCVGKRVRVTVEIR